MIRVEPMLTDILSTRAGRSGGGILASIAAAVFVIVALDLLTPPRDIVALQAALTPTSPPPATAPPTVLPPMPPLYFSDDFSKREYWQLGAGSTPYGYSDDGYALAPQLESGFVRVLLRNFGEYQYDDLSLEIRAAPARGSAPVEYGVLFWHSAPRASVTPTLDITPPRVSVTPTLDTAAPRVSVTPTLTTAPTFDAPTGERFIYFSISTSGAYRLRAHIPVTPTTTTPAHFRWIDLTPALPHPVINTDGRPNRVRVDVHPKRVLAFINDILVLDRQNADLDSFRRRDDFDGRVGLFALALGVPNARVLFTEFRLYVDVKR